MTTPVLFLIYRRPELTARVLAAIALAKPTTLLVAADAPHPDRPEEIDLCQRTRAATLAAIDWPCSVETRFSDEHQGCRRGVAAALAWAFAKHEKLIVLEDDCLPDASFFPWCQTLLDRYEDDRRIMHICGSNLTEMRPPGDASFYFSRFGPIWGWASWRRAWQLYDVDMRSWPEVRASNQLQRLCPEPFEAAWRREVCDSVHSGRVDTWDYQWAYARIINEMFSIVPAVNLVQNIGFGEGATHTTGASRWSVSTTSMSFPLHPPVEVEPWRAGDQAYLEQVVGLPRTALAKLRFRLGQLKRRLLAARH